MARTATAAIALAIGIAVAAHVPWPAMVWLSLLPCALLTPRWRGRVACGLVGAALFVNGEVGRRSALAALEGRDDREEDGAVGVVRGAIDESSDGWRFQLETAAAVLEVSVRGDPREACGPTGCEVLPGDRIAIEGALRSPRGLRVPGAPDEVRRLAARGAVAALATDWARVAVLERGGPGPWRWAAAVRRGLGDRLAGADADAALLRALVLGAAGDVPLSTAEAWRDAGVSHLLAVSGMHLAAVALLAFAVLRRLLAALPCGPADPSRLAACMAAPLAAAYTMVTGAPPSAVRALIAVSVYFLGVALGRRGSAIDALALAALAILAVRPAALFDPSLQLSVAATAALALAGRARSLPDGGWRPLRWLEQRAWLGLRASLAAALATAPLTALHFGVVQPGGAVANLIAAPATELVALPVGLCAALLGSGALAAIARGALSLADHVAAAVAGFIPTVWTGPPRAHELALIGVALLATRLRRRRAVLIVAALAGLAASWLVTVEVLPRTRRDAVVHFVDVGQGDAALIELPGGGAWLIDGGGRPFVSGVADPARRARIAERPGEAVVSLLGARRIRRLDRVALSHPHPDHYLGLSAIARRVPIGELWLAEPPADRPWPPELRALLARLAKDGTRVVAPPLGIARAQGGAALSVLWPRYRDDRAAEDPALAINDDSMVVRLEVHGRRVLFAGDLEAEGEELLAAAGDLAADVVKVPHHGSRTSSTAPFVAATTPSLAIISCGVANRFGFPAAEVLDRWRAAGAAILRTDQRGTISVAIAPDGAMRVSSFD